MARRDASGSRDRRRLSSKGPATFRKQMTPLIEHAHNIAADGRIGPSCVKASARSARRAHDEAYLPHPARTVLASTEELCMRDGGVGESRLCSLVCVGVT